MADIFEIAGRIDSTSYEKVVTTADQVLDTNNERKQSQINAETYNHVQRIDNAIAGLSPQQQDAIDVAAKANCNEAKMGFYVCGTGADVADKAFSAENYVLGSGYKSGGSMKVRMTHANTAASGVTLNINNTGALPLYYDGEPVSASNTWEEGETVEVYLGKDGSDNDAYFANNVAGGSSGGAYDVSKHFPTGNGSGGNTYTLATALAKVPTSARQPGMSVKFVESPGNGSVPNSDNKYVQYRLMHTLDNASTAATDFTNTANWQGVDAAPTLDSQNIPDSNGTFRMVHDATTFDVDKTSIASSWGNRNSTSKATFELDESGHNGIWHLLANSIQSSAIRMNLSSLENGKVYNLSFDVSYEGDDTLARLSASESSTGGVIYIVDYYSGKTVYIKNGHIEINIQKTSGWSFLYIYYGSIDTLTYPLDVTISNFSLYELKDVKTRINEIDDELPKLVSVDSQSFTDVEKKQARQNLGFGNGTFDDAPTENSHNPIDSGAVYAALQNYATTNVTDKLTDSIGTYNVDVELAIEDIKAWKNVNGVATQTESNSYSICTIDIIPDTDYLLYCFCSDSSYSNIFIVDENYNILKQYGIKNNSWQNIAIQSSDTANATYILLSFQTNKKSPVTAKTVYLNQLNDFVSTNVQDLSDAQKAQARDNIGVTTIVDTIKSENYGVPLSELPLFDKWISGSGELGAGKHSIIPISGGDSINISIGSTVLNFAYLKEHSSDSIVLCDDTTPIALSSSNKTYTGTAPSDAKYFLIDRLISNVDRTGYINKLTVNGYDVTEGFYKEISKAVESTEMFPESKFLPIVKSLNRTVCKRPSLDPDDPSPGGQPYITYKTLTLATLTDIHGSTSNMQNFLDFIAQYSDYIDDGIILGDIASNDWRSTAHKTWPDIEGYNSLFKVIGNHDVANYPDPETGTGRLATAAETFDFYMQGIEDWGVEYTDEKCYYYKDYVDANVRLIVYDSMHFDREQSNWLENTLYGENNANSALALGRHVIIAAHIPLTNNRMTFWNCNFTSADLDIVGPGDDDNGTLFRHILEQVDTFQQNGGVFIMYMFGHWHFDAIGVYVKDELANYPNQMFCVYPRGGYSDPGIMNDTVSIPDTINQNHFTLTSIDTKTKRIRLYRVGNNFDRNLIHRESICISYEDGDRKVISQY